MYIQPGEGQRAKMRIKAALILTSAFLLPFPDLYSCLSPTWAPAGGAGLPGLLSGEFFFFYSEDCFWGQCLKARALEMPIFLGCIFHTARGLSHHLLITTSYVLCEVSPAHGTHHLTQVLSTCGIRAVRISIWGGKSQVF